MESCFILSIESEGSDDGTVTYSVEGVLNDGHRMQLRVPTKTVIGQIVKALQMAEALDPRMIAAIDRLQGSYRLHIDIEERAANRFVDAFKRSWATLSPVQ